MHVDPHELPGFFEDKSNFIPRCLWTSEECNNHTNSNSTGAHDSHNDGKENVSRKEKEKASSFNEVPMLNVFVGYETVIVDVPRDSDDADARNSKSNDESRPDSNSQEEETLNETNHGSNGGDDTQEKSNENHVEDIERDPNPTTAPGH